MDCSRFRRVCLLAFREEARDHKLLQAMWCSWAAVVFKTCSDDVTSPVPADEAEQVQVELESVTSDSGVEAYQPRYMSRKVLVEAQPSEECGVNSARLTLLISVQRCVCCWYVAKTNLCVQGHKG